MREFGAPQRRRNPFEPEVAASARHLGCYYRKLVVGTMGPETRFTLKSPYDSFVVTDGRFTALELKSLATHGSFPLSNIESHQITGLQEVEAAGGNAWLLVNMRRDKAGKLKNQAWALSMGLWDELMGILGELGRKSVPYNYFTDQILFQELARRRVTNDRGEEELVWDLRPLLGLPFEEPAPEPAAAVLLDQFPYDPRNPWAVAESK